MVYPLPLVILKESGFTILSSQSTLCLSYSIQPTRLHTGQGTEKSDMVSGCALGRCCASSSLTNKECAVFRLQSHRSHPGCALRLPILANRTVTPHAPIQLHMHCKTPRNALKSLYVATCSRSVAFVSARPEHCTSEIGQAALQHSASKLDVRGESVST